MNNNFSLDSILSTLSESIIPSLLNDGTSPDEIAEKMSSTLNEALALHEQRQKENEKLSSFRECLEPLLNWLNIYYDLQYDHLTDEDLSNLISLLDTTTKLSSLFEDSTLGSLLEVLKEV